MYIVFINTQAAHVVVKEKSSGSNFNFIPYFQTYHHTVQCKLFAKNKGNMIFEP